MNVLHLLDFLPNTLSVTFGDSSPKGRAKRVYPVIYEKWSVSVPIRSIHYFTAIHQTGKGGFLI